MTEPLQIRSEETVFANLGDQLRAVMRAAGGDTRSQAKLLQVRSAALGGSEAVPSDGGFLVAPEFSREILKRAYLTSAIWQRCLHIPIGSSSFKRPQFDESSRAAGSRLGGVQMDWDQEASSIQPRTLAGTNHSQKPAFNNIELKANKLTGLLNLTSEVDADSDGFNTWCQYAMAEEMMFTFENCVVQGTGAGQPEGIMNSPSLITVPAQSGQQPGTVLSQNIYDMIKAFWGASYNSTGSIWLYNQQLLGNLAALATIVGVAGGQSTLWQWCNSNDNYDRLAGIPALQSEYCSIPGTPGDIILCDLSRYIIATREIRQEISIHVLFLSDENCFRFVLRAGGQTVDRSSVTALNGSPPYQTSSFVALGQR